MISDADVSALKEKYRGSVEGQSWLISKYLGGRKATSNLHYVREFYWSESQLKALKKVTISKDRTLFFLFILFFFLSLSLPPFLFSPDKYKTQSTNTRPADALVTSDLFLEKVSLSSQSTF